MSGMELEQAILEALHEDPADEASWLVLADCLEDQMLLILGQAVAFPVALYIKQSGQQQLG